MSERFTLADARERIDESLLHTLMRGMQLLAATGLLISALVWALHKDLSNYHATRLVMGVTFGVAGLGGLLVAKRAGVKAAARYLVSMTLLLSLVTAWRTGTGVMSATMALPATMILMAGFVLGPRAGLITSACSAAGVALLWMAQSQGWISGATSLNAPPPMTYGMLLISAFLLVGTTVAQYSRLLWRVILSMDAHRKDLEDRVSVQAAMQAQLEDSRQRLTTLLDHAPQAVVVVDKNSGVMRFANRHALAAHGASSFKDLASRCASPQSAYNEEAMLKLIHQARDVGSVACQWATQTVQGQAIWWSLRMELLTLSDAPEVVIFGQDITESQRQERALLDHKQELESQVRQRTAEALLQQHRLSAVIEALPVALTIKDRDGRYVLSNRRFEEGLGISKDMLLGATPDELFPPALATQFMSHEQSLLVTPQVVRFETSMLGRDGLHHDHLVTKVPLMDAQQRPEAVLTVSVDITEQKAMQRELAAAKTDAEHLSQVKTDFLSNMSHEIRTPLHGMLGMAQVAQANPGLPVDARAAVAQILQSGHHLMRVIDDILEFSRLDAGKLTVAMDAYEPAQLAQQVQAMVAGRAREKGLALHVVCGDAPRHVLGDQQRTRQILINLLANAIKFTTQGSVTLHLRTTAELLCFDVIDTGIGMPSESLHRVFSPFEQADSSTSRRFGGTGLGLSISRHLARLQGGDIGVHSQHGQGSTFTLCLPLRQPDTPPPEPSPEGPAEATFQAQAVQPQRALQGLRILAADDVDINREILLALLRKRGADIVCTEDGQQAVAELSRRGAGYFDLVLMDVQMPVMDGLEATRRLHALDPDLPVLALTAHALPEERARCAAAGMAGHLAKPFDAHDMVAQVLHHSRRRPTTQCDTAPPAPPAAPQPTALRGDIALMEVDKALARCGGQTPLLRKLLQKFADQQADFVRRHQGDANLDTDSLGRAVHQLKGTAANLGLPALSACAAALESTLRTQPDSDPAVLRPHWDAVAASLDAHLHAVRQWLGDTVAA